MAENYNLINIQSEEPQSTSTNNHKNNYYGIYKYLILFIVLCFVSTTYGTFSYRFKPLNIVSYPTTNGNSSRVLVVYVFSNTHSLSISNLEYFIRFAVHKSSNIDYYIILQQLNNTYVNETNLPNLPSYAYYIQHENKCFDLGTIGWFLSNEKINLNNYKYFIFLNSSVRGPYLVAYYTSNQWYSAYTQRLNNYIKLVGSTISCENTPYVQSYFWVTDRQGLFLLLKDGNIFACHKNHVDAIYQGEILASQVIINAGFNIGSLMKKYQYVDFRQKINRFCDNRLNLTVDSYNVDGITLDPFEVVFINLKFSTNDYKYDKSRISTYDKWIQ